mgnify:CR=1 FL=1
MKVKELIAELQKLPQDSEIVITSMADYFFESDFEVHSSYEDGQAQEIIVNRYIDKYGDDVIIH